MTVTWQAGLGPEVLRVSGLHKSFGGHTVLNGVTVELRRGEVVLLRGHNGSGKTTLLNILTGNLKPDSGHIELFTNSKGERLAFPQKWRELLNPFRHFAPERMANQGIGRTWQDIRLFSTQNLSSNIAVAAHDQLGESPLWALLRPRAVHLQEKGNVAAACRMLGDLGLKGRESSSADRISLGQSKRVAIARAVHGGAKILFLDEPLSGLDAEGIEQVLRLLESLAVQEALTLVIVEHVFNIPRLLDIAHTVWTLEEGQVVVQAPAQVRENLNHPGAQYIDDWSAGLLGPRGRIIDQELHGGARLSLVIPDIDNRGETVLDVRDLVVCRGQRPVLGIGSGEGGLSFAIREGELAILRAPNGWGKTTLLEAIVGLIPTRSGTIRLCGTDLKSMPAWDRAALGISMLQSRDNSFPGLTVRDNFGLVKQTKIPIDLQQFARRLSSSLSGGQRQKVALSCVLNQRDAKLHVLDEPFSSLDVGAIREVADIIAARSFSAPVFLAAPGK